MTVDDPEPRRPHTALPIIRRCPCGMQVSAVSRQSADEALAEHHKFSRAREEKRAEVRE